MFSQNNYIFDIYRKNDLTCETSSLTIIKYNFRLDANSHFVKSSKYFDILEGSESNIKLLSSVVDRIIEPKLFTRIYTSKRYGIPYISSSEMIEAMPNLKKRFISRKLTKGLDDYIIKMGQILISAAGTVGSSILAPKYLEGVAGTSDILRVEISRRNFPGYIYIFLQSPIGQSLLKSLSYGSVINRIRHFHVLNILIPFIGVNFQKRIDTLAQKARECREYAYDLLMEADDLVYSINSLKPLYKKNAVHLAPEENIEASIISSKDIFNLNSSGSKFRLDASYYSPYAMLVQENLKSCGSTLKRISEVTNKVFFCNRFKRKYVNKEFGIPYIAGKNINQIRIPNMHFISKAETERMDEYLLKKGWILLTCSGTIGRICFIWKNFEGYFGTHDLIRIIPDESQVDPGYIHAFLACRYGQEQILKFSHGSVIDHITPEQAQTIQIAIPNQKQQKLVGDKVRTAYEKRAEAIRLEDEAQEILMKELGVNKI
jgi:type I restriction enzyme S subunit